MTGIKERLQKRFGTSPPKDTGSLVAAVGEELEAGQSAFLEAVDEKLDKRLARFEPFLAKAEEDEKKRKEEEEDVKALAQINERRVARGLKPFAEKDDYMDEKKESPGKHEKKSKSEEKENPFEKKEDDKKDEAIAKLTKKVSDLEVMLKASQTRNLGEESFDFESSAVGENRLTLASSGRTIPFGNDWKFANEGALDVRAAIDAEGNIDELNEFDVKVANLKHKLKIDGVQAPVKRNIKQTTQLFA